jgi:hypothetical protein
MVDITEKPSERLNTSWLNCSVHQGSSNDLGRQAGGHARPATAFADDGAEPLPRMFRRPGATGAASKPCRLDRKARFSPYVIALVLFAFAPGQAALLMSSFPVNGEDAIDDALALAKKGAAEFVNLVSVPSAEAAVTLPPKTVVSERALPFEDDQWSGTVNAFKRLLAEQNAFQASVVRTENDRLIKNLEAWLRARAGSGSS